MSSYALGAIQMMTPSTLRRRNVTERSKGSGGVRQSLKSKSNHHRSSNPAAFNNGCLPSTLTFHDHPGGSSSGNIGLSQLTMSQLSDTMSHTRGMHDRSTAVVGTGLGSIRRSKVARTMRQTRPSTTIMSRNDDGVRRQNSKSRQMLSTSSISSKPSQTASIVETSKSSALKLRSLNHLSRKITSKETMERVGDLDHEFVHVQQQQSSQLRSQLIVLSPPRNPLASSIVHGSTQSSKRHLHTKNCILNTDRDSNIQHPTKGKKSTLKSVTAPSRKRSWMDACIDVMKTPYRTGKSIAERITNVKVEENDQVKVKVDEANAIAIAHGEAIIQQHPSSFETPSHRSGKKSNAQDDFERNEVASTKISSMLREAKELVDKIEQAKKDLEKERLDFEKSKADAKKDIEQERINFENRKADAVDEMNRQAIILQKEREAFDDIKKEQKEFHHKIEEAQSKFSVHVWSAEEKFNCHLDTKQSDVREELKQCQLNIIRALEEKQKEIQIDFDIKFASYFKLCQGSLAIGTSSAHEFFAPLIEPNNQVEHKRYGSGSSMQEISISSRSSMKMDSVSSMNRDQSDTNDIPTTTNLNNCDFRQSKMPVPCQGSKSYQVFVASNASKRVSPTKSQTSSTTNKSQGQCDASYNCNRNGVQVKKAVANSNNSVQVEKAVDNSNDGHLNFVTPMTKKRKHVDTKRVHCIKSSKYNLRSKKNSSSLESTSVRSGDNIVVMSKKSKNMHAAGIASESASTTGQKKSSCLALPSSSSLASQNENLEPESEQTQSINKHIMKKQTDISDTTLNTYRPATMKKQRCTSRRRRRINGRAKLGRSQQSAFCSRNEVSEISTTTRIREGIREKQTPMNQGPTTPINYEVRRMDRIRQMRQIQPRVHNSPVGVACNINLPMIPQLDVPAVRSTNTSFLKPRNKFLSQVDSDSLSFT